MKIGIKEWDYMINNGHVSEIFAHYLVDELMTGDKEENVNSISYQSAKRLEQAIGLFLRDRGVINAV